MKFFSLTILVIIAQLSNATACDCNGERSSIKELLKNSKQVFIGTFQSSTKSEKKFAADPYMIFYELEFKVDEMLSGDSLKEVIILGNNTNCTPMFEIGKTYLIYSFYHNKVDALLVNQCFSICPETTDSNTKTELKKIRKIIKRRKA